MLELRRKKVIRAMVGVLLVFGASLVYFLFFNTGLNVVSDPEDTTGKVLVVNDSVHLIREISISYVKDGAPVFIEKLPRLNPGEHHVLLLRPEFVDKGAFTIQATAPFHLGKQLIIDARSLDGSNANIAFSFQYPVLGTVGVQVEPAIEACNNESFPLLVIVEIVLDSPDVESVPLPLSVSLTPFSCTRSILPFTPTRATETLSFKIRVSTPSKVLTERTHTMRIVSNPDSPFPELDQETDSQLNNALPADSNAVPAPDSTVPASVI